MDRNVMMKAMKASISNVLEKMFFKTVTIYEADTALPEWFQAAEPLTGASLSFEGPESGSIYFIVPESAATQITADFLGLEADQVDAAKCADTVKEALNMIGGSMLSGLDRQRAYKLGIPRLIEAAALEAEGLQDFSRDPILLETAAYRMVAGCILS